jgi:hypothetical protein
MLHVELAPDILAPDIERRLVEGARAEALEPDAYASRLIASMIAARTSERHLSKEELERFLAGMVRHSDKTPDLPEMLTHTRVSTRTMIDAAVALPGRHQHPAATYESAA